MLTLRRFLASRSRLSFSRRADPDLSIIVVLNNKAHLSYACLHQIATASQSGPRIELIIADSGSTDETSDLLSRVDGASVMRCEENIGFIRSVNKASEICVADYIVLLNNDATLQERALDFALETIRQNPKIAAVGGRIVLPSGVLQEAGCILWSDGSTAGYGRGHSAVDGAFMFRRSVAFSSGVFLMVRRDLFVALDGLDDRFAPAYYEDVDLCVRLRQAGFRVVDDPRAVVLHYEFGSATSRATSSSLQETNRVVFVGKHREFLIGCPARGVDTVLEARSVDEAGKRILFLDDHVPHPELGVGYPRARAMLHALRDGGNNVTFVPLETPRDDWPSIRRTIPLEVEVMLDVPPAGLRSFLASRLGYYDLIFVSRPNNMRSLLSALEGMPSKACNASILYDAEASWATREILRRAVDGVPMSSSEQATLLEDEIGLARAASHVTAVSEQEAAIFSSGGCHSVSVVSYGPTLAPTSKPHADRKDILFVGALDDDPSPNADALTWLVEQVLPVIRRAMTPSPRLVVAGRCAIPRLRAMEGPDVAFLGKVDNLDPVYDAARVFIAPHRYAAGIPIKVLDAAARGVPCVVSDLLATQLGWRHGLEVLSASTAADYVRSVMQLYLDEVAWATIRNGALRAIERTHTPEGFVRALDLAVDAAVWSTRDSR